jgi:alpha-methylacyl-CoA racemase
MSPLEGLRVVELAAIGPVPFAGMILTDLGAQVTRIDRADGVRPFAEWHQGLDRGRERIALDLKHPDGTAALLRIVEGCDVLLEGFRPGVAERLGIGPQVCHERNPGLIYGRMTGWGQDGPLADTVGHDINYLALSGALDAIGPEGGDPVVPLNLLGDFAGGSMFLVAGILAALYQRRGSGRGQVVDAAIVDGAAHLTTMIHAMRAAGVWQDRREANLLDGGAPFYGVYETSDGGHMAVGALEERFYAEFAALLGLTGQQTALRGDPARWPELRAAVAARFRSRSREEWTAVFTGADACTAPVLSLAEAPNHPHLAARGTFTDPAADPAGVAQPAPAPRFSATPTAIRTAPAPPGAHTAEVARDWDVPALVPTDAAHTR